MGELKIVVKNKDGEVKSGFKQERVKGVISKFSMIKQNIGSKKASDISWVKDVKETIK